MDRRDKKLDLLFGEGEQGELAEFLWSLPNETEVPDLATDEEYYFANYTETIAEGNEARSILKKAIGEDGIAALSTKDWKVTIPAKPDADREEVKRAFVVELNRFSAAENLRRSLESIYPDAKDLLESDIGRRQLARRRARDISELMATRRKKATEKLLNLVMNALKDRNADFFDTMKKAAKKTFAVVDASARSIKEGISGSPSVFQVRSMAESLRIRLGRWPWMYELVERARDEGFYANEPDTNNISSGMSQKVKRAGLAGFVKGKRGPRRKKT